MRGDKRLPGLPERLLVARLRETHRTPGPLRREGHRESRYLPTLCGLNAEVIPGLEEISISGYKLGGLRRYFEFSEPNGKEGTMSLKQIRLSAQAREQLIRLKTRTGISQWNVLCRWAFCLSLQQPTPPTPINLPADSNVEMTWQVFGGEHHELYLALLKERCERDGLGISEEVLGRQFRLHLHRGISYLATPHMVRSITDLCGLILPSDEMDATLLTPTGEH